MDASKTIKIGIIGRPLGASVSPLMYKLLFARCGYAVEYVKFDIGEDDVAETVDSMRRAAFWGFNVTMPHKVGVMRYLDRIDVSAQRIGAVNLVRFDGEARVGYNTDGEGFLNGLMHCGFHMDGARVALIGSGGAAMAIASACAEGGAASVAIVNRTRARAEAVAVQINRATGKDIVYVSDKIVNGINLIVNATPLGMYPNADDPLEGLALSPGTFVADAVYKPYKTPLIRRAEAAGLDVMPGLYMLFFQGVASTKRWLNRKITLEADEADRLIAQLRAALEELTQ